MARILIRPGVRYLFNNSVYLIKKAILNDSFLVENLSFGSEEVIEKKTIIDRLYNGELKFEVAGRNTLAKEQSMINTSFKETDFVNVNEKDKLIAEERYAIIKPLLNQPRTRQNIMDRIAELDFAKLIYYKSVSPRSIYRWLRDYEQGRDIRSLLPEHERQGGKGKSRLSELVDEIIALKVRDIYLSYQGTTFQDTFDAVKTEIRDLNKTRSEKNKIKIPHYNSIVKRIKEIDPYVISLMKFGKKYADKCFKRVNSDSDAFSGIKKPLQLVYIDHTPLDLFVVDANDRLPIGRPNFTYMIDFLTGYPLGFYVGFTPPSYESVAECMYHAIMPKTYVHELYPDVENKHLPFGFIESICTDHGKEFFSKSFRDSCRQLGIHIEYARVKCPEDKSLIERQFGKLNQQLLHKLPGTSFSNIVDRKDYDPLKNAVISLEAFNHIAHLIFFDYFANEPRKRLGYKTPLEVWLSANELYPHIEVPHSADELRVLLGSIEERTIQATGIQFEELKYQSGRLMQLKRRLQEKEKVTFKYYSYNLEYIDVWDNHNKEYFRVNCTSQEYAKGLSLWKHKIILKQANLVKKNCDDEILLATKKKIQTIVENEWKLSKKTSTRKNAARFIGIENSLLKLFRGHNDSPDLISILNKGKDDPSSFEGTNNLSVNIVGFETDDSSLSKEFTSGNQISTTRKNNQKKRSQKKLQVIVTKKEKNLADWS